MANPLFSTFIRIPVNGFVGVTDQELKVIDTPTFQKLTRIKQLSNTYLVYPGANHTRFEHSIGTMGFAQTISDQINLDPNENLSLRLASLLHDVGHGPFSHVFEATMKLINQSDFSHEDVTKHIINYDPEINSIIKDLETDILDVLYKPQNYLHGMISSDYDVDKMDYFLRDSYHLGVDYGTYDYKRLILTSTIIENNKFNTKTYGLTEKGSRAYESFRLARFNLWEQVYEHHTRIIADCMMKRCFEQALNEEILDKNKLNYKESDPIDFLNYYNSLDDHSIQHMILSKQESKSRKILLDLRNRRLFKRAYIIKINSDGIKDRTIREKIMDASQHQITAWENDIAEYTGLNPENIMLYIQNSKIKGYSVSGLNPEDTVGLSIKMKNGIERHIDEISPLKLQYDAIRRLFVFYKGSEIYEDKINEYCEDFFNAQNDFHR